MRPLFHALFLLALLQLRPSLGLRLARSSTPFTAVGTALGAKRRTTLSRRKDASEVEAPAVAAPAPGTGAPAAFDLEPPPAPPLPRARPGINEQLQSDISSFEERALQAARERNSGNESTKENGAVSGFKSVFSAILIADFFVVIVFLVWFLAAAALQSTNPWLLERFQDIFNPVVVPSLTVLMVGSIASGALEGKDKDKR